MKTLFNLALICIMLFSFAACSDNDDNGKDIELMDGTQTTQTVYADQTSGSSNGIKFSTTGPWQATVSEVQVKSTSGSTVDWLKLSQYSGDKADNYTLALTLTENFTGKDRKAEIKIVSGGTSVTITVEQMGTTKTGQKPEEPNPSPYKYFVEKIVEKYDGELTNTYTFFYNDKMQLVKIEEDNHPYPEDGIMSIDFSYNNKTVSYTIDNCDCKDDENKKGKHIVELTLNNDGYVTSGKRIGEKSHWSCTYNNGYIKTSEGEEEDEGKISALKRTIEWTNGSMTKVTDEDGWYARASYTDTKKNPLVNLDINWLIASSEPWDFTIASDHSWDTLFPMAMGLYGKTSPNYIKEIVNPMSSSSGQLDIFTFNYVFTNDLVTRVTSENHTYDISYITK